MHKTDPGTWQVRDPTRCQRRVDEAEAHRILRSSGPGKVVRLLLDVDQPEHRHRLWSVGDSQILHYVRHFAESRKQKRRYIRQALSDPTT